MLGALISASLHQENYLFKQNYLVHWTSNGVTPAGYLYSRQQNAPLLVKNAIQKKVTSITHNSYENADVQTTCLCLLGIALGDQQHKQRARQPNPSSPSLLLPWEESLSISPGACWDQSWWTTFPALLIRRSYFTRRRDKGRGKERHGHN